MASQPSPEQPEPEQPKRWPPNPNQKKRLQKCFEHASKQMAGENYDYATVLFSQCVFGDPENRAYVQGFLGNLQKKYGNNRKGPPWPSSRS